MDNISHDILIIGGGLAGLRAATAAANEGLSVGLVSKVYPMRSHTVSAEGGAAAVVRDDTGDSLQLHFETPSRAATSSPTRTSSSTSSTRRPTS